MRTVFRSLTAIAEKKGKCGCGIVRRREDHPASVKLRIEAADEIDRLRSLCESLADDNERLIRASHPVGRMREPS